MRPVLAKVKPFTNDVIFIDGLWGSGKSLLAPIISGMQGVEKQRIEPAFEYLCIVRHLDHLTHEGAVALLQIHADTAQYNNLIGREVNLRWHDDSGALNNPNTWRYVRRMLSASEGAEVADRIDRENLALQIMSHMMILMAEPLVTAFGRRLKIVEMVRHPVYMVKHWQAYLSRFDGAREFTVSFDCDGQKVPWFVADWVDEYLGLSLMDRILAALVRLYDRVFAVADAMSSQHLLIVSFEDAVLKTDAVLEQLETFLGRPHHPRLSSVLKKQKLPRRQIAHGKGHAAYGWSPKAGATEREDYDRFLAAVHAEGTAAYVEPFLRLVANYNRRWPSVLNEFA